jgi:hypothetical protein
MHSSVSAAPAAARAAVDVFRAAGCCDESRDEVEDAAGRIAFGSRYGERPGNCAVFLCL